MNVVRTLAGVEFSRYRSWMPGAKGCRWATVGVNQLICLAASLYFLRTNASFELLYAFWVMVHLAAVAAVSAVPVDPSRRYEWWLTIPQTRMKLILGKALGDLRMGLHLALYLEATVWLHYLVAVQLHWMPALSPGELAAVAAAFTLLDLAGLVPAVGLGLLSLVFERGWLRLGRGVYGVVFVGSMIFYNIAANPVMAPSLEEIVNPVGVLRATVWTVVGGWPAAWLCMRLAAGPGLRRLGDLRLASDGKRLPKAEGWTVGRPRGETRSGRSVFRSLYALERSRYRLLGPSAPPLYRVVSWGTLAVLIVGGYLAGGEPDAAFTGLSALGMGFYGGAIWYSLTFVFGPFRQGWGSWWLAFPHSRLHLLGSRWLAFWTAAVRVLFLALVGAGCGVSVRALSTGMTAERLFALWKHAGDVFLVSGLLFTVNFLIMQIIPLFYRWRAVGGILLGVLWYGFFWEMGWIGGWTGSEAAPSSLLGHGVFLLAGIGIPFGLLCFWIGARHLHQLLFAETALKKFRRTAG